MSEPAELAKTAREQLALALSALQTNTRVPDDLMAVAEPIAEAMGILHKVERSNGADLEGRDVALTHVRGALDSLQRVNEHHPATEIVMEKVASSLAKVHALARYSPPAAPIAAAPVIPVGSPVAAPNPAVARAMAAPPPPLARGGTVNMANNAAPASPSHAANAAPKQEASPFAPFQVQAPSPPPASAAFPLSPPAPPGPPPPPPSAPAAQPAIPPAKSSQSSSGIDVELGTHSPSNFYKGLGGNDVIDHGGIFVATYKIPKIGSAVTLRVLLPGDLEFHATAVVQWTRDAAGSSEPGFGARFTQISQEGRQLVYRYTRNREPMFYDDL